MGIQSFIVSKLNQTAVYWGNPQKDGYGGFTYDDPVEIDCRWEDMTQVVRSLNGEEFISRGEVFVNTVLEENGLLYLGTIDDLLDSEGESSGEVDIDNLSDDLQQHIFLIRRPERIPALNSTDNYFNKVYLTPYISWE
jgi:hypothetical protein